MIPIERLSGLIAGYDPGGNGRHGLALGEFQEGECRSLRVETHANAESVMEALEQAAPISAIGVDTVVALSTGDSGWREADHCLRRMYKDVGKSVISPNGLYGSMALNGMAVLGWLRGINPRIHVTETHPKVLYRALDDDKYDYTSDNNVMDSFLSKRLGVPVKTGNDHEWDAAVSVLAAFSGFSGRWNHDLFTLPMPYDRPGRLVFPVGFANYWWPCDLTKAAVDYNANHQP